MHHPGRARLGFVLLLLAVGCSDGGLPTGPVHADDALHHISDGSHDGTEGFYFLPPMVKNPVFSGIFDPTLSPVVEICETTACVEMHATFTMAASDGGELVRLNEVNEHYIVSWNTDRTEAVAGPTYRVRIRIDNAVLGHADVQLASSGKEAKNIDTNEAIALVDGRTLPIKFRIETHIEIVDFAVGSGGGTIATADETLILEIPQDAVQDGMVITVESTTDPVGDPDMVPGLVFEFGPSGTEFDTPLTLTIKYDPANLPTGMEENSLRMLKLNGSKWIQIGSTVNTVDKTVSATVSSFSSYGVGKVDEVWQAMGSATSAYPAAFTVYDGSLVAGVHNYVIRWDGSAWVQMGGNVPAIAVAVYENDLIAGDSRWDRMALTWQKLSDGEEDWISSDLTGDVRALLVHNDTLFAGGDFGTARWNGRAWESLDPEPASPIYALVEYNGELIAGGMSSLARWDGTVWEPMVGGIIADGYYEHFYVRALAVHNGELIAGGIISLAGRPNAHIARWDDAAETWQPIGTATGQPGELRPTHVAALAFHDDTLIAGGSIWVSGVPDAANVAAWDEATKSWEPLGGGVSRYVSALTVYNNELIGGAAFGNADGGTVNHVARLAPPSVN
jgi:hypothetical protein